VDENAAIEVDDLKKSYGAGPVLDEINFRVRAGSVFALLGPNGAGKTTTVRILATLVMPDGGSARISGRDVVSERRAVRQRISLTGQYAALDELQTGRENLEMMGRLRRLRPRAARARASELLELFDLADAADRRVAGYSGGMRRRLDLAAGLVNNPEVIFLDEPTTGLDPRARQAMWRVVTGLAAGGVTVLLTTQYLDEAERLADSIAVLDAGRIVAEGSARDLKQRVGGTRLDLQAADPSAFEAVVDHLGPRVVRANRSTLTIATATDGSAASARAVLDQLDPDRVRIARFELRTASLDDVFMTLTGSAPRNTPESEPANV
jgi:ABC-2 type transport system ATP-binding protein